ncbi:MAG: DUF4349 domain-containing protein [Acidimicrobiales bacterium]
MTDYAGDVTIGNQVQQLGVEPPNTLEGTMKHTGKLFGLLFALLIVAAACGDSDDSASFDSGTSDTAATVAPAEMAQEVADVGDLSEVVEATASGVAVVSGGGTAAQGRDIIRTANLTVRVANMPEAIAEVEAFATTRGGFVASESIELEEDPFAVITIRVPAGDFDQLLDDIGGVGELLGQEVNSQDVTGQVIDLESRIASAEVSIERLRGFLENANNVSEITNLEAELSRREAETESMKAQLRGLEDRVSLTTATVTLTPEETDDAITPVNDEAQLAGFQDGLSAGWSVLAALATLFSALVGALLPFVPLIVVGFGIAWYLRKRSQSTPA